ncbi:MAG TPA: carboxypeptidase regulatory-like domain-containing protein [Candidatus Acidoferrales bacterium]|nr:carboxypeptidase regulatory-like domain-containing protein [Candidatus Acidoferrales bacterium]
MRARWLSLGLLLATATAGAGQQGQRGYRIGGVVVDAVSGAPVARAELSIAEGTEETKAAAGEDGRFVFPGLSAGKYPLYATAPGYVREAFNQHGQYSTGIAVGNGLDSEHVIFRLHRQAVITGRVTDEHGEAVRQAMVMLIHAEGAGGTRATSADSVAQTNDLGEYRFARLAPGRYYVAVMARPWYAQTELSDVPEAKAEGADPSSGRSEAKPKRDPLLDAVYPITLYPGVTNEHAAGELNLTAGEKAEADIAVAAVPAVHVHLTNLGVEDRAGSGIEASVMLFGSEEAPLNISVGQIAPGEYEVAGLVPGEVTFTISEAGVQASSARKIKAKVGGGDTLDAGGRRTTAKVSGRVIFPGGDAGPPVMQVKLSAEDERTAMAVSEQDGTFSLPAVEAGTYKVAVELPRSGAYVANTSATGAKTAGREITIAGAGDVQLSITLGEGTGQLTGVAKLEGRPAAGMMVLLAPESGENLEEDSRLDQSDSDGTFTLREILPGKYVLVAIEEGWDLDRSNWGVLKPYLEKGQALQIAANEQKDVVVKVQRKRE